MPEAEPELARPRALLHGGQNSLRVVRRNHEDGPGAARSLVRVKLLTLEVTGRFNDPGLRDVRDGVSGLRERFATVRIPTRSDHDRRPHHAAVGRNDAGAAARVAREGCWSGLSPPPPTLTQSRPVPAQDAAAGEENQGDDGGTGEARAEHGG